MSRETGSSRVISWEQMHCLERYCQTPGPSSGVCHLLQKVTHVRLEAGRR